MFWIALVEPDSMGSESYLITGKAAFDPADWCVPRDCCRRAIRSVALSDTVYDDAWYERRSAAPCDESEESGHRSRCRIRAGRPVFSEEIGARHESMQELHSNDPHGIHKSSNDILRNTSQAIPNKLRAKAFTIAWALAVLVATAGWLYFVARVAAIILNWLVG